MDFRKKRKSIFDLIDEMMNEFMKEFTSDFTAIEKELEDMAKRGYLKGPYVYGVRVTIGPDGVPRVEEFGNVKREGDKPVITNEMEPLVDVFEDNGEIIVVAEVPGVSKDDIEIKVKPKQLIIKAKGKDRKYYKTIDLPKEVIPEKAKASYKNGVLEVRLKAKDVSEKDEGVEIKVE
ncbi:MAG: Hsp20/alpha crystallin family protein [Desulfurococcales archaeon]|nr:Hsp20/alpha crystallin family protein [Desulfurococcales archaeon]MEB3758894.1 Hsp20/alpha crystallin family protein [Desulfurococcales archaeon]MEB3799350.1 Hsp20/alpha crystallin family protein [Desulfurococcales archaeon]